MAGTTPSPEPAPLRLWLVRHGETEWSAAGRHTGTTDIPLDGKGRRQADALGQGLAAMGVNFDAAWTSPLVRARETATRAGFGDARVLEALREWDYGEYEGRRTADVRREEHNPGWLVWTAAIRRGETPRSVGERADTARETILQATSRGNIIVFSHGHFLRMFAARWIGLPAAQGQHWTFATGTVSILGHEHEYPVIERWNTPIPDAEDRNED